MAELQSVAGSRFYIGTATMAPASNMTAASFSSVVWTEVLHWTNAGPLGEESAAISIDEINSGIQQTIAGTETPPPIDQTFALDYADAGQSALIAARASKKNYPFKVTFGDTPSGGSSPSIRYFVGIVLTAREDLGTSNTVKNLMTTIRRNSNLVRVAAA